MEAEEVMKQKRTEERPPYPETKFRGDAPRKHTTHPTSRRGEK